MKKLGYLLITVSFLAGSLTAVMDKELVNWMHFVPALVIGFAGVIMVAIYDRRHNSSQEKLTGHLTSIETSLSAIVKNIASLCAEGQSLDTRQVHKRIDALFAEDITSFVGAREAIAHVYGLQEYADVMSYFASAERAINRAWSASTDGYADEVRTSLQKANDYFNVVLEKINNLKQAAKQTENTNED